MKLKTKIEIEFIKNSDISTFRDGENYIFNKERYNKVISDLETTVENHIKQVLSDYNDFLLNNGYTDDDIITEHPAALERFLNLDK